MTFEDWCGVKKLVDELNDAGIIDIFEYARQNSDFLGKLGPAAKILDANPAAVTVYKASDKATLLSAFNEPPSLDTYNPTTGLSDIFVTLVDKFSGGETRVELQGPDTALDDSGIYVRTTTSITRGHENDRSSVLQTVEDFTRRKAAEDGHELSWG